MHKLSYPWHHIYWQHLTAYVHQQRVPQALLINGIAGLGKLQLAMQFSQYLSCLDQQESTYCGKCEACQLFTARTHPDFTLIEPEEPGKAIGVDRIRKLSDKLSLAPQYSAYRVVVIMPAEQMNLNAANAFLKCLEEPPTRTVFLLLSERMQVLPATISSRCQKLLLKPPELDLATQWMQEQGCNEQAQLLLGLAHGAPLQALAYAQKNILEQRKEYFSDWQSICLKGECPVQVAAKWYKGSGKQLINWLISWTEDIIKCVFQIDSSQLLNSDVEKNLAALARRVDLNRLFKFYRLLLQNTYRIQTSLNKQLLFEEMLITWSQVTVNQ